MKLKEASYVHAEGYPAGELKHGPNALVSDRVPLVVLATVDRALEASVVRYEKTLQLLAEMKTQGAKVIALANAGDRDVAELVSDCVEVQPAHRVSAAHCRGRSAATVRLLHGHRARRGRGPAKKSIQGGCGGVEGERVPQRIGTYTDSLLRLLQIVHRERVIYRTQLTAKKSCSLTTTRELLRAGAVAIN